MTRALAEKMFHKRFSNEARSGEMTKLRAGCLLLDMTFFDGPLSQLSHAGKCEEEEDATKKKPSDGNLEWE